MAKIINESNTFSPAHEVPEIKESQNLDAVKNSVETYNIQAKKDLMETQEALQKEVEAHAAGEPEPGVGNTAGDGEPAGDDAVDTGTSETADEDVAVAEDVESTDAEETTEAHEEHVADDHVSGDDAGAAEGSGSDASEVLVNGSEATSGYADVSKDAVKGTPEVDEFTERPVPTEEEQRNMNRKAFDVLKKLPYIDLYNQLQDAQKQVHELIQMHDAVAAYNDGTAASVIASMNEAERNKWLGSVKEFRQNYRSTYVDGRRLVKFITAMLQCYDGTKVSSTSFISKSMVESAEMRRDAVERREIENGHADNKEILLRRINNTISAYADRIHYPTLINKLRYPNNILELWKTFFKIGPEEVLKIVDRVLSNQFNDVHMARFRNAIQNMVVSHETPDFDKKISKDRLGVIIFFMTYWLATVYEKEFESGKCAEVKTYIMSVYDCDVNNRIYDMPGGPALVESFSYLMFTIFLVITSGSYSAKQLHREVGRMFNDLLKVYDQEEQAQIAKFPGTVVTDPTNFESTVGGSFEDVDAMVDYNEKIPGDDTATGPVYELVKLLPDVSDAAPNTIYLKETVGEDGAEAYEQWTVDELGWSQGETITKLDGDRLLYGELPETDEVESGGTSDFVYRIVKELPSPEDISFNRRTIYLMKTDDGYHQYVWKDDGFKDIGDISASEANALTGNYDYFVKGNGDSEATEETNESEAVEESNESDSAEETNECSDDSCPIIFPDDETETVVTEEPSQTSEDPEPKAAVETENAPEEPKVETSPEPTEKQTYVIEETKKTPKIDCVVDNDDPWDPTTPGNPEVRYWIHNADGNYTPMMYDGSWKVCGDDESPDRVKDLRHITNDWPGTSFASDLPANTVVVEQPKVEQPQQAPRGFGQIQQPPQRRPVN